MAHNLVSSLPDSAIRLNEEVSSWEGAVRLAGEALVASGAVTPDYTDEMIQTLRAHGPYIVIVPHIALAHSRPSASVLSDGLSWVSLKTPVAFGHAQNDPVKVVIGLAARGHETHISTMAELAALLGNEERREKLISAKSLGNLKSLIAAVS